ncbi:unnamed protein product [Medioppia subpectinata]|uniref:Uncharacterized protein n=1 Tax=Medioppia subpectinata TaxID=1979941 RepID=A0A7R9L4E2_9ACAR|nr:unnamed protein product [Medioppia subpectinata]CAG2115360.1 unnamed protein product [Medioppia subpectinata]
MNRFYGQRVYYYSGITVSTITRCFGSVMDTNYRTISMCDRTAPVPTISH